MEVTMKSWSGYHRVDGGFNLHFGNQTYWGGHLDFI